MAKIPIILEAGRADGILIKTNNIYDDNKKKFLSDKLEEIDNNNNTLNNTVKSLTNTINNNKSDIETKLEAERIRATNAENNLRETINTARETATAASTAATEAKTAAETAQTTANGKQDALTLTVKDNGNIVLANIQGQSKEFMPATPSGDPMHYAYVTAGAEYNDTGADIVKDAPWADMIDDDYTGEYGKTVVHKAGYWYLNGLGDIPNAEMNNILLLKHWYCNNIKDSLITDTCRVLFPSSSNKLIDFCHAFTNSSIVVLNYNGVFFSGYSDGFLYYARNLVHIISKYYIDFSRFSSLSGLFTGCSKLMTFKLKNIKLNISLSVLSCLSVKSVLYMINNEAATSPITITLHADVYNRCMANEDILAALEAHTNISIASA